MAQPRVVITEVTPLKAKNSVRIEGGDAVKVLTRSLHLQADLQEDPSPKSALICRRLNLFIAGVFLLLACGAIACAILSDEICDDKSDTHCGSYKAMGGVASVVAFVLALISWCTSCHKISNLSHHSIFSQDKNPSQPPAIEQLKSPSIV